VKAFGLAQAADWPGLRASGAEAGDEIKVILNFGRVKVRRQRGQPLLIQGQAGFQEFSGAAKKNHAHIHELLSLNSRRQADERIIK